MSNWTLSKVKKQIGRQCGDPDVTSYPDAIQDHLIDAIESLAEDIVAIADLTRALTDSERVRFKEVLNILENEISPMITEVRLPPSYSNKVATFNVNNTNFPRVIKVRDLYVSANMVKDYKFDKIESMKDFIRMKNNPHLQPSDGEAAWYNAGNIIDVFWGEDRSVILQFHCLTSQQYDNWTTNQDLQSLGFGSNFLTQAVNRAAYTMRLQLNLEKE